MVQTKYWLNNFTKYLISLGILGGSALTMIGLFMLRPTPQERPIDELMPTASTATISRFDGKLGLEISGMVAPYREIDIAAEVAGQIDLKSDCSIAGCFVKSGTQLVTIDKLDYELEIDRLKAELKQANNLIHELDEEIAGSNRSLQFAQEDYDLQKIEYERRKGIGNALSASELDQAKRNLNSAERGLTELNNSLSQMKTRKSRLQSGINLSQIKLSQAELNLTRTQITAPFDGVIVEDLVEQGDFVQKGSVVVRFEDTSKVRVKFNLRLDQLDQILRYHSDDVDMLGDDRNQAYKLPRMEVRVIANISGREVVWTGQLEGFDGIGVDEQTKTIPCRAIVNEPITHTNAGPKALVRGMFVKVEIDLDPSTTADAGRLLTFPAVAVQPGGIIWTVSDYRSEAHVGLLKRHHVSVIDRQEAGSTGAMPDASFMKQNVVAISVDGQVKSGDMVVVSPLAQPTPDIEVRVLNIDGKQLGQPSENNPQSTAAEQRPSQRSSDQQDTTKVANREEKAS